MKYEFRTATGQSCCKTDNLNHLCEHCRGAALAAAKTYTPPDPYRLASVPRVEIVRDRHGIPQPYASKVTR